MKEGAQHELPGGWMWTRLQDVSKEFIGGGTPSRQIHEYFGGNIIWLTPTEVPKNKIVILKDSKEKITESGLKHSSARIIPKDSVLLTSRASIGYVAIAGCDVTTNQGFASFVCSDAIYNFFLAYWLWANKQLLESNATGTTFKEISKSKLRGFYLPLPPFPEQRAIVSKIEQLFSDLDNGIENFKKAQAQLKLYHQSVLKAACEGKLVPIEAELARAEGRDYEAADVLLARILKERREKWNGKGKYKEAEVPDRNDLSKLPKGWCIAFLEQIAEINPKSFNKGLTDNTEVSFLPMKVVEEQTGRYNLSIIKKYNEVKKGYTSFINGDIIFAKITPCMENGKIAVVENLKNGIGFGSTEFHVIRFSGNDISRTYIFNFIVQENFRRDAKRSMTGSAGQLRVPTNYLRQTLIPLPPLAEQRRIVAEVERRLSVCDKMEATIIESLQKAESLRQSVLKKAFEGKLLNKKELEKARNAPDWEPSEKLLERIKEEKMNLKTTNKDKK